MTRYVYRLPGSNVVHRDEGCRYLDGVFRRFAAPDRFATARLVAALEAGALEMLDAPPPPGSKLCASCYSADPWSPARPAAGYRRCPE